MDLYTGIPRISEGFGIALEVLPSEDGKSAETFDRLEVQRQTPQRVAVSGQPSSMLQRPVEQPHLLFQDATPVVHAWGRRMILTQGQSPQPSPTAITSPALQ
jgi:hypothetical protein